MLREDSLSRYLSNALASLAGPFAQLVFLASLRDPYTGRYLHEGWASVSSPADVHRALRDTHGSVFESVVSLPLIAFCGELRKHFQSLGEVEWGAAKMWLEMEPYYEMIPEGCPLLSRRFFISQFRTALEVLIHAPDWAHLEEPTSLPVRQPGPPPRPRYPN